MSFVPATSNRDLWTVLGLLVAGALAVAWRMLRPKPDATPEDPPEIPAPEIRP